MTINELYTALKAKGYTNPSCEMTLRAIHTCKHQTVKAGWFRKKLVPKDEQKWPIYDQLQERDLRNALELDRREVFWVWFNKGAEQKNLWDGHLLAAHTVYASGGLDYAIDYLLTDS